MEREVVSLAVNRADRSIEKWVFVCCLQVEKEIYEKEENKL